MTWEGRVRARSRRCFADPNALPDLRVLAGIAEELGAPARLPHRRARRAPRWPSSGPWDGERAALRRRADAGSPAARRRTTGCALATWKLLIDNGSMQDGDDVPRGHRPHAGRRVVAGDATPRSASPTVHAVDRRPRLGRPCRSRCADLRRRRRLGAGELRRQRCPRRPRLARQPASRVKGADRMSRQSERRRPPAPARRPRARSATTRGGSS